MRADVTTLILTAALSAFATASGAQTLPFDHIHVNEPAAEGSQWWEKNIPGARRIAEAPNRLMYGAVRLKRSRTWRLPFVEKRAPGYRVA